jgi:hypothetical protein
VVDEDRRLVGNKAGATRLGFAVLLKFFELEARFPSSPSEIPAAAIDYVADQVGVDAAVFVSYPWTGRAIERHRVQIRHAFGLREFTRGDEDKLADWLAVEVCPVELREGQLHEALLVRCRSERSSRQAVLSGSSGPRGHGSSPRSANWWYSGSATTVPPGWRNSPRATTAAGCWRS